jgi:hypothetical protein
MNITNITYTIARYEQVKPDIFLVAFNIKDENDNSAYIEYLLKSSQVSGKTTQEVCQLAYKQLLPQIEEIKLNFEQKTLSKVGYIFIPEE